MLSKEARAQKRRFTKKVRYRKDSDAVLRARITESEERASICRQILHERGVAR